MADAITVLMRLHGRSEANHTQAQRGHQDQSAHRTLHQFTAKQ
jgi:hypothetical protein